MVLAHEVNVPLQRLIEPAERRAAVARDHGGGVEPAALVGPALIEGQAHEGLDSRQEDLSVELAILGVEREVVLNSHGLLDRGAAVGSHVGCRTRARGVAVRSRVLMIAGPARTAQTP
jgi:hypothetical protein